MDVIGGTLHHVDADAVLTPMASRSWTVAQPKSSPSRPLTDLGWGLIDPTERAAGLRARGRRDRLVATIDVLDGPGTNLGLPDGTSYIVLRVGEEDSGRVGQPPDLTGQRDSPLDGRASAVVVRSPIRDVAE